MSAITSASMAIHNPYPGVVTAGKRGPSHKAYVCLTVRDCKLFFADREALLTWLFDAQNKALRLTADDGIESRPR